MEIRVGRLVYRDRDVERVVAVASSRLEVYQSDDYDYPFGALYTSGDTRIFLFYDNDEDELLGMLEIPKDAFLFVAFIGGDMKI